MGRRVQGNPKSICQILLFLLYPQVCSFSSHIACSQSSRQTDFPNFLWPKMSLHPETRGDGEVESLRSRAAYMSYSFIILQCFPCTTLFQIWALSCSCLRKYDMHQGLIWVFPFHFTLPFPGSGAGFLLHSSFPCLTPGRWMQPRSRRADLCCETR